MAFTARQMQSMIEANGKLTLSLEKVSIEDPGDDEVIVRVEATPVNPSDLGLMLGPADLSTLAATGHADGPVLTLTVPESRLAGIRGRLDKPLPIGNEGAGTVVAAGRNAGALQGRRVGMIGGAMYADYRKIRTRDVVPLPDGASAMDGASMFINPLTALGFVETARGEGHKAIVHTAAASNLGQMLQKICSADGIPLVNIVRSPGQVEVLSAIGATHVLDSSDGDFADKLTDAIEATGATIAFDATGGGTLGSDIVQAMERAALRKMTEYNRYGSDVFKHLYVYGNLVAGPTTINRPAFGFQWSVSGWLLFPFLRKISPDVEARLRTRILSELNTTFASRYARVIGLAEALEPEVLKAYERKATGEKVLIDPTRG